MATEVTGTPRIWYFVSDSYKKSALSRTDHYTWYLSTLLDTVGRTGLWQLLGKCGCLEKHTTMIEAIHTGMTANVSVGVEVSE